MSKQILSEEFKRMQKLAGLINETFDPFLDTEEGGYMREYIDEIAEEEELNLEYRDEFNTAFKLALAKLKKDQPQLDFVAIEANKESFF